MNILSNRANQKVPRDSGTGSMMEDAGTIASETIAFQEGIRELYREGQTDHSLEPSDRGRSARQTRRPDRGWRCSDLLLPPGKVGNSEAGHGPSVLAGLFLKMMFDLSLAMKDGSFHTNEVFLRTMDEVKRRNSSSSVRS